jgi:cardiolipin synthase
MDRRISGVQPTLWRFLLLLLFPLLVLLGALSPAVAGTPVDAGRTSSWPLSARSEPGPGVTGVKLFVEPQAGTQVILKAIAGALRSLDLEIYLLTDRDVVHALENAALRGLRVRVMLEPHPYGGGSPDATLRELRSYGVETRYTSPAFPLTHAKIMIVDRVSVYIMTCNFTRSALGGSSSAVNREYGIIDALPADVGSVAALFEADWQRSSYSLDNANLVVSPLNARGDLLALINGAHSMLIMEAEEMQDGELEGAIAQAEQRGVGVKVIVPPPSGPDDANASGIARLVAAGVQVREDTRLYMHAKMLLVDGREAFVGSQNISTASLNQNREVGILVADAGVLATLESTFQQDWSDSQAMPAV